MDGRPEPTTPTTAAPRWSRSGRLGIKLALSLGVLLVAVLSAEVAHRLWYYGPGGLSPMQLASVRDFGDTGFTRSSVHAPVEYELRPDVHAWFKLLPFETNSQGLRDREYEREKVAGTFRIAVIGDSYTMGSGVPIDSVYHSVLERSLNEIGSSSSYECLNFGVAGYSLLHYAGVIEHMALDWNPDLILIGLVPNDDLPPPMNYLRGIFPEDSDLPLKTLRGEAPARSFLRLTMLDGLLDPGRRRPREDDDEGTGGGRYRTRLEWAIRAARSDVAGVTATRFVPAALQRIRALAGDVPVFCVYLDTSSKPSKHAETFARQVSTLGLGFLDTRPLFEGLRSVDYWILPGDGHPNAGAHAMYARALHDALTTGGWLE